MLEVYPHKQALQPRLHYTGHRPFVVVSLFSLLLVCVHTRILPAKGQEVRTLDGNTYLQQRRGHALLDLLSQLFLQLERRKTETRRL